MNKYRIQGRLIEFTNDMSLVNGELIVIEFSNRKFHEFMKLSTLSDQYHIRTCYMIYFQTPVDVISLRQNRPNAKITLQEYEIINMSVL